MSRKVFRYQRWWALSVLALALLACSHSAFAAECTSDAGLAPIEDIAGLSAAEIKAAYDRGRLCSDLKRDSISEINECTTLSDVAEHPRRLLSLPAKDSAVIVEKILGCGHHPSFAGRYRNCMEKAGINSVKEMPGSLTAICCGQILTRFQDHLFAAAEEIRAKRCAAYVDREDVEGWQACFNAEAMFKVKTVDVASAQKIAAQAVLEAEIRVKQAALTDLLAACN